LNLLLDTHILLWWLASSRHLPAPARAAILGSERIYVSAATAWEIGIKVSLGRLAFDGDMEKQLVSNNFLPLHVTLSHAVAAGQLPQRHKDPFDRMLIAQAKMESLTLLTHDRRLKGYDVDVLLT
jgi:PIN domain nuclease of toxin-antitoxin system